MADIPPMLKTLDRGFAFKLILALLVYSLAPLAEIFLFIYLGDLLGNYLVLALAAVAGAVGVLVVIGQLRRARERLKAKIDRGRRAEREYVEIVGILAAAVLLVTPGFITDLLGFLLLVPIFREAAGRLIVKKLKRSFPEIHEHLRLSALEGRPR